MQRRQLLVGAGLALAGVALPAAAAGVGAQPYSRELYEQYLASGDAFMLDFFAPW